MSDKLLNIDWEGWPQMTALAKRLWQGRAAIMVGAGFSRNAIPRTIHALPFPLWGELSRALVSCFSSPQKRDRLSRLGPEALADRFRIEPGNDALVDLLETTIPDKQYEPGPLHSRLLRLPWSDVFTTNYDTLLERTAAKVSERNYGVVRYLHELASKTPPRVIKLHGTLGDQSVVLGAEDYRRYPIDYAPFVNTVQQSMLENAFCLVGFSGTDSNFLAWTGWVRDNLGKLAPPVYLCGYLNIDRHEQTYLHRQGIHALDFASVIDPNSPNPHGEAIEVFISQLEMLRPTLRELWPNNGPRPTAPQPSYVGQRASTAAPPPGASRYGKYTELLLRWKSEREFYPGWLLPPADVMRQLELAPSAVAEMVEQISRAPTLDEQLFCLYELEWRRWVSLGLFDNDYIAYARDIVTKLLPDASANHVSEVQRVALRLSVMLLQLCRATRAEAPFRDLAERLEQSPMLSLSDQLYPSSEQRRDLEDALRYFGPECPSRSTVACRQMSARRIC